MIIQSFIQVAGTLTILFVLNWRLSFLVVLGYISMFLYIRYSGKKSTYYFNRQQQYLGELNGYIEELIQGQKVVKVFNHESDSLQHFQEKKCSAAGSRYKSSFLLQHDDSHGRQYFLY